MKQSTLGLVVLGGAAAYFAWKWWQDQQSGAAYQDAGLSSGGSIGGGSGVQGGGIGSAYGDAYGGELPLESPMYREDQAQTGTDERPSSDPNGGFQVPYGGLVGEDLSQALNNLGGETSSVAREFAALNLTGRTISALAETKLAQNLARAGAESKAAKSLYAGAKSITESPLYQKVTKPLATAVRGAGDATIALRQSAGAISKEASPAGAVLRGIGGLGKGAGTALRVLGSAPATAVLTAGLAAPDIAQYFEDRATVINPVTGQREKSLLKTVATVPSAVIEFGAIRPAQDTASFIGGITGFIGEEVGKVTGQAPAPIVAQVRAESPRNFSPAPVRVQAAPSPRRFTPVPDAPHSAAPASMRNLRSGRGGGSRATMIVDIGRGQKGYTRGRTIVNAQGQAIASTVG